MNHNTPRQGTSRVRPSREEIQDHANYFRQVTREETTRAHHARSDALGSSAAQSVARSTRLATIPKILVQLFKGKGKNKEEKQEQFGRAPPGIFHPSTSTMDSPAPPRQQPLPVLREQSPAFSFTSRESIAAAEEMRETESRDSLPRSVSPVRRLSLDSIDLQLPIKHFETILPWYQTAYPTGIVLKFNEHSAHSARAEQLPLETVQWGVLKPGEKMLIDGRVHSLYSLHRDYNNQGVIINGIDVAKLTRNRLIVTTKHRFKVPDVEYDSLGVVDFDILESSGTLTLHIRRPGSYATEKAFVEVTDSERMSLLSECLADEKKKHLASRRGAPELLTLWVMKCRNPTGPIVVIGWTSPGSCLILMVADRHHSEQDGIQPLLQYYCAGRRSEAAIMGECDVMPIAVTGYKPEHGCPYCGNWRKPNRTLFGKPPGEFRGLAPPTD